MPTPAQSSALSNHRLLRAALAVAVGGAGVALLLFSRPFAFWFPLMLLSNVLPSPPRRHPDHTDTQSIPAATAEVVTSKLLLGLSLFVGVVLLLAVSGPFRSWLTDPIPYRSPEPREPAPVWALLCAAAVWLIAVSVRVYRSLRLPRSEPAVRE